MLKMPLIRSDGDRPVLEEDILTAVIHHLDSASYSAQPGIRTVAFSPEGMKPFVAGSVTNLPKVMSRPESRDTQSFVARSREDCVQDDLVERIGVYFFCREGDFNGDVGLNAKGLPAIDRTRAANGAAEKSDAQANQEYSKLSRKPQRLSRRIPSIFPPGPV